MRPELLLQRLEEEKATFSKQALGSPAARDAYEYGRVVGVVAGLDMAKRALLELIGEHDKRGREL